MRAGVEACHQHNHKDEQHPVALDVRPDSAEPRAETSVLDVRCARDEACFALSGHHLVGVRFWEEYAEDNYEYGWSGAEPEERAPAVGGGRHKL